MTPTRTLYEKAIYRENTGRPPVWFMRQAGRYHAHYQNLKRTYSFIDLCKRPELATEVTFGPIRDFDFDAAILFSDLLFPLEILGMGLEYTPGPKLGWHLKSKADLQKLNPDRLSAVNLVQQIAYQGEALSSIRSQLDPKKSLLGFVGGPLTLFYYAVSGSHQGDLSDAKTALTDGRYDGFLNHIVPFLVENMSLQAQAGADAVAMMDTCAGEISPSEYQHLAIPAIREVLTQFRERHPNTPVVYYSKGTSHFHWQHLQGLPFECLGVDWRTPLADVLQNWGETWAIQGNFDPHLMLLPEEACAQEIKKFFASIQDLPPEKLKGWVCGLGHGILQWTPEANVRKFLKIQKEIFAP